MDEKLVAALVGVVTGTVGYWFTTFWMKPILQFRELKSKVLIDLIFYAQVVNAEGMSERLQELYKQRVESNRQRSAELSACCLELPGWYKWWLNLRDCSPERAATCLMGLSNTREYENAARLVDKIKASLGIKSNAA